MEEAHSLDDCSKAHHTAMYDRTHHENDSDRLCFSTGASGPVAADAFAHPSNDDERYRRENAEGLEGVCQEVEDLPPDLSPRYSKGTLSFLFRCSIGVFLSVATGTSTRKIAM